MKLALATDAWFPQVNGVVRSLSTTITELERRGHVVERLSPEQFLTMPLPGYASIRVAMAPRFNVRRRLDHFAPDLVHIATEGPIGWAARSWCLVRNIPFTSAFHTHFPEYAAVRTGISAERFWPIMRRFHAQSSAVLVSTPTLAAELKGRGIGPTMLWSRGIDPTLFRPDGPRHPAILEMNGPVLLYVGRVAPEKNIAAFLEADVPGTKVVVGDGPSLEPFRRRYPNCRFLGGLSGAELASAYRSADCFVFPSLTDTFGLVVIEALASGVPVAAFPVAGPLDILGYDGRGESGDLPRPAGALDANLSTAITKALRVPREDALALGRRFTWDAATDQFESAIRQALEEHHKARQRAAA